MTNAMFSREKSKHNDHGPNDSPNELVILNDHLIQGFGPI